jgi:hypothetical protein
MGIAGIGFKRADCRCDALLFGGFEWLTLPVRERLVYVTDCCIAALMESGLRLREDRDRWSRVPKVPEAIVREASSSVNEQLQSIRT